MKQFKALLLASTILFSGISFAKESVEDKKKIAEYSKKMSTIPYEIGPLKDPTKLPFKIGEPKNYKKEIESWLESNVPKYKKGSTELFGTPVLIRFREQVGYGICASVSGNNVFAGYKGSIFYLFLFNGDLISDVKNQSMLLGMDHVGDARVILLNAEIDHACISVVSNGLTLDNPKIQSADKVDNKDLANKLNKK